jgi:hypothetical protein
LKLAFWKDAGKSLQNYTLSAAREALHVKVGEGLIRKVGGDYLVEDVVREFPRAAPVPASLAQVHGKQTDTSKVVKVWKVKPGAELTDSEVAVLQMVNELWPDG